MRARRLIAASVAALAVLALASCSSDGSSGDQRQPITEPYVVTTDATHAWLMWPSNSAWLVLGTADRFASVSDATPPGIDTGGGLAVASGTPDLVLAVGISENLVRSPVMIAAGRNWRTGDLPTGVAPSQTAVAMRGTTMTVVTSAGELLARNGTSWQTLTSLTSLPNAKGDILDGVRWADVAHGWLTGHGPQGSAKAWATTDGGKTWTAMPKAQGNTSTAYAPCGSGASWVLPLVTATGTVRVLRTDDMGLTWAVGASTTAASGNFAWGCSGRQIWLSGRTDRGTRIITSSDAGMTFTDSGSAPGGLTALVPTGGGRGYAAAGGSSPKLWVVSDNGAQLQRVTLPDWVASAGPTQMGN